VIQSQNDLHRKNLHPSFLRSRIRAQFQSPPARKEKASPRLSVKKQARHPAYGRAAQNFVRSAHQTKQTDSRAEHDKGKERYRQDLRHEQSKLVSDDLEKLGESWPSLIDSEIIK